MKLPYFGYDLPDLTARIREALADPLGGCMVEGMPCSEDNAALEALCRELGEPLLEPHNLGGGMVCRVEVEQKQTRPYANTPWHFPGHTDCSDHARPPDTVLLLCEQPAASGGGSFVAPLAQVLETLALDDVFGLQEPQFFFRYGYLPILGLHRGRVGIRYNRVMLEMFTPPDQDPGVPGLLDRLDQAVEAASFSFSLRQGDCLILNNYTTLHGRTAFEDDGQRLLKRVRLDLRDEGRGTRV